MTKEAYVTFEVAKLLRDKGFDTPSYITGHVYSEHGTLQSNTSFKSVTMDYITACTQQMAMRWLREKYNIYISIQPDFPSDKDYKMCWCCSVDVLHEDCISTKWYQCYIETYEEACEAAIKYCLENLI